MTKPEKSAIIGYHRSGASNELIAALMGISEKYVEIILGMIYLFNPRHQKAKILFLSAILFSCSPQVRCPHKENNFYHFKSKKEFQNAFKGCPYLFSIGDNIIMGSDTTFIFSTSQ